MHLLFSHHPLMNIVVISTKLNDVKVVFIIVFDQVTNVVYQSVL